MKALVTGIALSLISASALAAQINLIDGDTLVIDGTTVRIIEIDTPETYQPRCENELIVGLKAKARLAELVRSGANVTYEPYDTDRYGRTLAKVFAGKLNVGETLIREGHALRYEKGIDSKMARLKVWCPKARLMQMTQEKPKPASDENVYYPNCAAARAAGAAPIRFGEAGYSRKLDRDGDGIACE